MSATVADFSRRGARSPRQRTALADDTEQWVAAFRTPSKTESSPFEIFLIDERKCDRESAKEARRFEGIPGPGFQLSSGNHLVLRVCHARLGASDACHMRGAANREREDVELAWFPVRCALAFPNGRAVPRAVPTRGVPRKVKVRVFTDRNSAHVRFVA